MASVTAKDVDPFAPSAWEKAGDEAKQQAIKDGLNTQQTVEAMVEAQLPLYKEQTGPGHGAEKRKDLYANPDYHVIGSQEYPALNEFVASSTEKLNQLTDNHYNPPIVMVVKDLARNNDGTPALYSRITDTVQFDADYLATHPDQIEIEAITGHELGHRYQNSDAQLKTNLRENTELSLDQPVDAKTSNEARILEAEADFRGAQLTSPAVMRSMLLKSEDFMSHDSTALSVESYREKTGNPNLLDSYKLFAKLPSDVQHAYGEEVKNLSDERYEQLAANYARDNRQAENSLEKISDHPSTDHRLAALVKLDEVDLSCMKNVTFDPSYQPNVTAQCTPSQTPGAAQVQAQANKNASYLNY